MAGHVIPAPRPSAPVPVQTVDSRLRQQRRITSPSLPSLYHADIILLILIVLVPIISYPHHLLHHRHRHRHRHRHHHHC